MPNPATARKRKPHGPGAKPRGIVAGGRRAGRTTAARQNPEFLLLRIVARLSVDAQHAPSLRDAHGSYVRGCLAMLEALGAIRRDRVIPLLTACNELLDGRLNLQDIRDMKNVAVETDPTYLRAISLVRRAGQADAARLAAEMEIGERAACELLDRMEATGVIGAPDMFGVRLVLAREVGHA